MTDSPVFEDTIVTFQRVIGARLRAQGLRDGIVAVDGLAMLGMLIQVAAIWASQDPEGFGYAMQAIAGSTVDGDEAAMARAQMAAWMTDHALGRCTACEGDRP